MVGAGGDGGQEDREGGSRTHQRQQMRCVARARCASRPRRPYLALQRLPPPGLPEILGKSVAQYIYYINVIHWVLLRIGALLGLLLFDSPHRLRHLQLLSALALRSILREGWGGGMRRRGERDGRKRRCASVGGSEGEASARTRRRRYLSGCPSAFTLLLFALFPPFVNVRLPPRRRLRLERCQVLRARALDRFLNRHAALRITYTQRARVCTPIISNTVSVVFPACMHAPQLTASLLQLLHHPHRHPQAPARVCIFARLHLVDEFIGVAPLIIVLVEHRVLRALPQHSRPACVRINDTHITYYAGIVSAFTHTQLIHTHTILCMRSKRTRTHMM